MSCLVIELRAADVLIVNGAPIRFRNKARIELTTRVRFLFGKQVMPPAEANTPARRLYFALQTAYIGEPEERAPALARARDLAQDFADHTTSGLARHLCVAAIGAAEHDDGYQALKYARRLVQHEAAVLAVPRQETQP